MKGTPVYKVKIPEYKAAERPDYAVVGGKIDEVIKFHFNGKHVGLRYLSLKDHPGLSIVELTNIIMETGTDRYDPSRRMSVAHDFYAEKGVELFAMPVKVNSNIDVSTGVVEDFFEGALADRGYSLRVDIVVVYNLDKLEEIPIKYDDGNVGEGDYKFRDPKNKADAVLGIIQIL